MDSGSETTFVHEDASDDVEGEVGAIESSSGLIESDSWRIETQEERGARIR
jgi:hypothetical protein